MVIEGGAGFGNGGGVALLWGVLLWTGWGNVCVGVRRGGGIKEVCAVSILRWTNTFCLTFLLPVHSHKIT